MTPEDIAKREEERLKFEAQRILDEKSFEDVEPQEQIKRLKRIIIDMQQNSNYQGNRLSKMENTISLLEKHEHTSSGKCSIVVEELTRRMNNSDSCVGLLGKKNLLA